MVHAIGDEPLTLFMGLYGANRVFFIARASVLLLVCLSHSDKHLARHPVVADVDTVHGDYSGPLVDEALVWLLQVFAGLSLVSALAYGPLQSLIAMLAQSMSHQRR